jgi:hypothetical protein
MSVKLFGFTIGREDDESDIPYSPVTPVNDDGALVVEAPVSGVYVDLDASYRTELDLLQKYRQMALQPEMDQAISDIVDEAIVHETDSGEIVKINMDKLDQPDKIKTLIMQEFQNVIKLLDFNNFGDEIFRKWYIDGRLYYNVVIDNENPRGGIQTLIYIDSRKIKKVRQITKEKGMNGADLVTGIEEFYVYNDKLLMTNPNSGNPLFQTSVANGVRLSKDSVVQVNSGIYDPIKATILSYLHKAIRPLNMLRFVEDAALIYRVTRAPERRVFYIDVAGMNKAKAEQYLKSMMTNYRNKLTYDSTSGQIMDTRKHFAMLEDFWMPRNSNGRSTEIQTLASGQGWDIMGEVMYFKKMLYRALGVPESRVEQPEGVFNIGRPGEISRDELKFNKFVHRLRSKFSVLFDELMERQLSLKGICTIEEWQQFKQDIFYVFAEDNNFAELKDTEILNNRIQTLNGVQPFMGVFFSKMWVWKNILRLDDEEIKQMQAEMDQEFQDAEQAGHPPLAGYPPISPPGAPMQPMEPAMDGTGDEVQQEKEPGEDDLNDKTAEFVTKG